MRQIPAIDIDLFWKTDIETIVVELPNIPKEVIPDKILNISWLFI